MHHHHFTVSDHLTYKIVIDNKRSIPWHESKPIGWVCTDHKRYFELLNGSLHSYMTIPEAEQAIASAAMATGRPVQPRRSVKKADRKYSHELEHSWREAAPDRKKHISRLINVEKKRLRHEDDNLVYADIIKNHRFGGW